MRWFLIKIAYNIGNVVKTDKIVRMNGPPLCDELVDLDQAVQRDDTCRA